MHMRAGRFSIRGIGEISNVVANFHGCPDRRRGPRVHMAVTHTVPVTLSYPDPPTQSRILVAWNLPPGVVDLTARKRIDIAGIWRRSVARAFALSLSGIRRFRIVPSTRGLVHVSGAAPRLSPLRDIDGEFQPFSFRPEGVDAELLGVKRAVIPQPL